MLQYILTALIIIFVIALILKLLKVSVKLIFSFLGNAIIGFIVIFLLNLIPNVNIAYDWLNGIIVGLFGVPGAIIALILSFVL